MSARGWLAESAGGESLEDKTAESNKKTPFTACAALKTAGALYFRFS